MLNVDRFVVPDSYFVTLALSYIPTLLQQILRKQLYRQAKNVPMILFCVLRKSTGPLQQN